MTAKKKPGRKTVPVKERFENLFTPEPNSGCWLWDGTIFTSGYGSFWLDGRMVTAHRVSYKLYRGDIPDGLCVCHTCDVRHCVNPDHFFLGTDADNMKDMWSKGRGRTPDPDMRGERVGTSRLTTEQVREIKVSLSEFNGYGAHADLARHYGVHPGTIQKISSGTNWAHI